MTLLNKNKKSTPTGYIRTTAQKIQWLLDNNPRLEVSKFSIAKDLCISRPTLDIRLKGPESKWKTIEKDFISRLYTDQRYVYEK